MIEPGRALHLRWRSLGLVGLGGALGTAVRFLVNEGLPPVADVPVGILAVNVVGAFVLGLLLERLLRDGPDTGRRRDLRLLLGTGFLGGFTTYSTLATDTVALLADHALRAAAYALGTLLLGAVAAALGLWCGSRGGADRGAP